MAFAYEALVGHLYVVSGRAIHTAPPGALVEVAPKQTARGRETDTFFVLVLPCGENIATAAFYTEMAQTAASHFFNTSGSITAGLRNVFTSLNQNLFNHDERGKTPYEANIICGVLHGSDLFVGRVGSTIAVIQQNGTTRTFPEVLAHDDALYTAPLGVYPIPNTHMTQYQVTSGTRILFCDDHLSELESESIRHALMAADIAAVLMQFKALAKLQLTLLAIELVPPDEPENMMIPSGQSTVQIAEKAREAARIRRTGEAPTATRKQEQTVSKEIQRRATRGVGLTALRLGNGIKILNQIFDRFFGPPSKDDKPWWSAPLGASIVVLVPLIVVSLVILLWLGQTGKTELDICLEDAHNRAETARSVANNNRATVIEAWENTLEKVITCDKLRPGLLDDLRTEAQTVLDALNDLTRLQARHLASLEAARLTRIVSQGQNLYVLDEANGLVYKLRMSGDGLATAGPAEPLIRTGGFIDGVAIGDIIDIVYDVDANVLVVLDRNGFVVECTPQFNQCNTSRLVDWELWSNPNAIAIWNSRIYILDPSSGTGQIWRYDKTGGGYLEPPLVYFGGPERDRPGLSTAIDLEIDGPGNVYILYAEGIVFKWLAAKPTPFGFSAFPTGQELESATAMYLDDTVTAQSIYVTHQGRRSIYETSFSGTYHNNYRIFDESKFDLLESVTVIPGSAGTNLIYAVSGNTVFVLEKDE